MTDLKIFKSEWRKIIFLKIYGKGIDYISSTFWGLKRQGPPKLYLLVILFSSIKRRLVGEKATNIFGNGTKHIFEY